MVTRCKFNCWSINPSYQEGMVDVVMHAITDDETPENSKFWEATPSGEFTMTCVRAAAIEFEAGKDYYIDISPVPEK